MTERTRAAGFTLVELMLVVVLIGILGAIAIPNFMGYQAKARRSESYSNLKAIATSERSYQAEAGTFLAVAPYPDWTPYGGLGVHQMDWDAASEAAFAELGWSPEGRVRYSYEINEPSIGGSGCTCTLCFTAAAHGNVDGDADRTATLYAHPQELDGSLLECPTGMFNLWVPGSDYDTVVVYDLDEF
jgi:type IV pilus assembly protein PilA